jgi:endo-alpha-1,4-polygalactosaminidase (GH114 family)
MPGFLYDRDWVATFAGVQIDRVHKYLHHFEEAKYDGIFKDPENPRWWKAKLYEMIYRKCKDKNASFQRTQYVANKVLKVKQKDESKCYVCKGKWPETVAYVDETDTGSKKQMHLKCTVAHPSYTYEPMFEETRMMAGEESAY